MLSDSFDSFWLSCCSTLILKSALAGSGKLESGTSLIVYLVCDCYTQLKVWTFIDFGLVCNIDEADSIVMVMSCGVACRLQR